MTISVFSIAYLLFVFVLFYLVRHDGRIVLLGLASLIYIFFLDPTSGIAVLVTATLLYIFGRLIYRQLCDGKNAVAKTFTVLAIMLFSFVLLGLKYSSKIGSLFQIGDENVLHRLVIPLGFSYYIFQSVSYLVDIYKGQLTAETNPFKLLLFLCYFPKFVSGPIERMEAFRLQMTNIENTQVFRRNVLVRSAIYMAYGSFLKLVVADRLGIYVDKVFADYTLASGIDLIIGSLGYTMQIYCDFAGYTAIAMGASFLFGIELSENFRSPYCSSNITEFWRRWHISLSSWLKDYIYIPLGGNEKGQLRRLINVVIVFLICGIWHGNGWAFLIWGLLHGIYSVIDSLLKERGLSRLRSGIAGRIITFCLVSFAWIFFRAGEISVAIGYILGIFRPPFCGITILPFLDPQRGIFELTISVVAILVVIAFDIISYRKSKSLPEVIIDRGDAGKIAFIFVFLFLTLIFGIYGPEFGSARYIYMNF